MMYRNVLIVCALIILGSLIVIVISPIKGCEQMQKESLSKATFDPFPRDGLDHSK